MSYKDKILVCKKLSGLTMINLADVIGISRKSLYRYASGVIPKNRLVRESIDKLTCTLINNKNNKNNKNKQGEL